MLFCLRSFRCSLHLHRTLSEPPCVTLPCVHLNVKESISCIVPQFRVFVVPRTNHRAIPERNSILSVPMNARAFRRTGPASNPIAGQLRFCQRARSLSRGSGENLEQHAPRLPSGGPRARKHVREFEGARVRATTLSRARVQNGN